MHVGTITYEDAKESKSRLPLIEAVVVLEHEGKRLPELALVIPSYELVQMIRTPKKRYRIPSNIALNRHRFRHICSKNSNWNGRMQDHITVRTMDRSMISIGAFHCKRSRHDQYMSSITLAVPLKARRCISEQSKEHELP